VPTKEEQHRTRKQGGEGRHQNLQGKRQYDEMEVKACLLRCVKDPCREKLQEGIRNRVDSYSRSIVKACSGMMHVVKVMCRDVTDIQTVEVPDEIFGKTFIRHLMVGTGETSRRNERVRALHENYIKYRSNDTRYTGDSRIYEYGAIKYLTNLKNHVTMNLKGFMIRSVFALHPELSRIGIRAIIDGIKNDSRNEQEIEFADKKTSSRGKNEPSGIPAAIQEHRADLGLVNPADKVSEMKKMTKDFIPASSAIPCFWSENSNARRRWSSLGEYVKIRRSGRLS